MFRAPARSFVHSAVARGAALNMRTDCRVAVSRGDTSAVLVKVHAFFTLVKEKGSVGPKFKKGSQAAGVVGGAQARPDPH